MLKKHFILVTICLLFNLSKAQVTSQDYKNLTDKITAGYQSFVLPSTPVKIFFYINLKQITVLDEKNQLLTTSVYTTQWWQDDRLKWNSSDYNGIEWIRIQASKIWLPDTYVLNTAETNGYITSSLNTYTYVTIHADGLVFLQLQVTPKTRCRVNTRSFPFDKQICTIRLTSWSFGNSIIEYNANTTIIDLKGFTENTIWNLTDSVLRVETTNDRQDDGDENDELVIELYLSRKPLYYMLSGVLPCLILNIISLISYLLPFTVQIGLSMTCFLTLTVNSVRVSNDIPIQSDYLPNISVYFLISIVYPFLSILWFITRNYFETHSYLPTILQKFANKLLKLKSKIKKVKPIQRTSKQEIEIIEAKCNFCNRCSKCETKTRQDGEKIEAKKNLESKIISLNYFVLFLYTVAVFVSQLSIWLSMNN